MKKSMLGRMGSVALASVLALATGPVHALAATRDDDLTAFSLEELSRLKISSVSKKSESLATSAASVFVITNQDIRRLGATTLPEALRLAPNLQVARMDANSWAISARGFNSSTSNKLLVLIDGRPVYTPLYSGVFWDVQDLYMPDVERIEVISGPSATTWGSNAVNGVINVVTRNANATSGKQLSIIEGENLHRYQARFGNVTSDQLAYRVYAKYAVEDDSVDAGGASREDRQHHAQAGFRMDFSDADDVVSLQGDLYDGGWDQPMGNDADLGGANLVAHWNRDLAEDSRLDVTAYYDRTERLMPGTIEEQLDTIGLEARNELDISERHSLLWGIELRHAMDDVTNFDRLAFIPAETNLTWASLFARDELRLSNNLSVMFGARAEHNDFTGLEFMPDFRLAWTPREYHTVWASVSRAIRTPSRIDTEFFIPAEPPFAISTSRDFRSEVANVLELGYRGQPGARIYYSVTAFHHDFDHLRSIEILPDGGAMLDNQLRGTTTGIEGWLSFEATEAWRISAGAIYMNRDLELRPESTAVSITSEGNDPDLQWQVHSALKVTSQQELDIFVRYVDALPDPVVPSYTTVDAGWSWHNQRGLRFSLHARNLFDEEHAEFGAPPEQSIYGRNVYARLAWNFD